jgi:hypothetical protein
VLVDDHDLRAQKHSAPRILTSNSVAMIDSGESFAEVGMHQIRQERDFRNISPYRLY